MLSRIECDVQSLSFCVEGRCHSEGEDAESYRSIIINVVGCMIVADSSIEDTAALDSQTGLRNSCRNVKSRLWIIWVSELPVKRDLMVMGTPCKVRELSNISNMILRMR